MPNEILDAELDRYLREHADEIAAEEGSPSIFMSQCRRRSNPSAAVVGGAGEVPKLVTNCAVDAPERPVEGAKPDPSIRKKMSALQKISQLGVGQRVQLAIKGSKDERFILVRDGSKGRLVGGAGESQDLPTRRSRCSRP